MALHEALIALQTGCSGLLTLKEDDPYFKKVRKRIFHMEIFIIDYLACSIDSICSSRRIGNTRSINSTWSTLSNTR